MAPAPDAHFEDDDYLETLAEVYLANSQFEAAISTLVYLTERRPAHAYAHQLMASALGNLGLKAEAAAALEAVVKLRPGNVQAKFKYAQLIGKPWPTIAKKKEEIIVVTGFPRSGTSLTMQLLGALGFSLYADGVRKADASNPQGYFESEAVKDIWRNPEFLEEAKGNAIKVVFPLVRFLPSGFAYRFLIVKRKMANVVQSQQKMMGQEESDFPLAEIWRLQCEEKRCTDWLQNSGYPFLEIRYEDLLAKNQETAQKITAFFGCGFTDKIWEVVRRKDG